MRRREEEIEKYLTSGEVIERVFNLADCTVYATPKRIFVKRGRRIEDYSYSHISSIGYEYEHYYSYIVYGIAMLFLGLIFGHISRIIAAVLFIAGIITIAIAIWAKSECVVMRVAEISEPVIFRGSRDELDSLLRIIRERRV